MLPTAIIGSYELRIQQGRILVFRHDLEREIPLCELIFELQRQGREPDSFVPVRFDIQTGFFSLTGHLENVITLDVHMLESKPDNGIAMQMFVVNPLEDMTFRLIMRLQALGGQDPRWMVPGIFYKHNRVFKCMRLYPAFSAAGEDPVRMLSDHWGFRSDRAASPAVFAWTSRLSAWVATDERVGITDNNRLGLGMTGIFFGIQNGTEIGCRLPYVEEPLKYSYCRPDRTAPDESWMTVERGRTIEWRMQFGLDKPELHSYERVLRATSARMALEHNQHPWMHPHEAEALATEGILNWHADRRFGVLYETASFDKSFGRQGEHWFKKTMHTGWIGGALPAYALLWRGHDQNDHSLVHTARKIFDTLAEGISPIGCFWPEWTGGEDTPWGTGLNPEATWIQARTLADATLFFTRALRLELQKETTHPQWMQAIRSNLEFALSRQREDGNLGSCYDAESGGVTEWEGCAGLMWIAALAAGANILHDNRFRDAAVLAGEYYAQFILDEFLYGAPEDQYLVPTSEDGYCAVIAYTLLYELDRNPHWLDLAKRAADWALTFRFTYNIAFSKQTLLGLYEIKTRGMDISSPAQQAIQNWGLVAYPEMLKISALIDDPYYRERAEEQRIACLQMIAREDGDFGARKGMIPGQWHHTEWWQPKGRILMLSHLWAATGVLYANLSHRLAMSITGTPMAEVPGPAAQGLPSAGMKSRQAPTGVLPQNAKPTSGPWATQDPRETQDIKVKWKIF